MRKEEYALMRRVEDFHWWYRSLRAMIALAWRRFGRVDGARPLCCDAGCGTGANLVLAGDRARAFGVDSSIEALRLARDRGLTTLARGDTAHLPFADALFDTVLSMDVLYHRDVTDPAAALREMGRILKPGGLLLLNVPAYEWLRSPHDIAVHTGRRFTRREVRLLLGDTGFEVVWLTYWNCLLLPAIATARLLRPRGNTTERSDLENTRDGPLNRLLAATLAIERLALRITPLPCGVSIFAAASRTATPPS